MSGFRSSFRSFASNVRAGLSRRRGRLRLGRFLAGVGLALLLAIAQGVAPWAAAPAVARVPGDIEGHWAGDCIAALAYRRIVVGDENGRFRPDDPATRAEFAAFLRSVTDRGGQLLLPFGTPAAPANPNAPLPRSRAIAEVVARLGRPGTVGPRASLMLAQTFTDADAIPLGDRPGVAAALRDGIVANYPDPARLEPTRPLRRGEMAALVCQALRGRLEVPATNALQPFVARSPEVRGVWITNVDSEVMFDRDRFRSALETLADLNFNTIYPTMWNEGYTLYPSDVGQQASGWQVDPQPGLRGRDLLAEAVAEGHRLGLTVVPWLEFGLMAPADSDLARRHPDWLTQRRDGSRIYTYGTHDRVWLNPNHPQVQQLLLGLVREIVTRYDADGIQFDDHLAMPVATGYDPTTVAQYKLAHEGQPPPENPEDPEWMRWRADRLTQLVGRIRQTVRDACPDCLMSLSPNPHHFSYPTSLQNWTRWVGLGWIDELLVQVYREDLDRFQAELLDPDLQQASFRIPVSVGVLTGLRQKFVPIARVEEKVRAVRQESLAGVSFFFYETLWNLVEEPRPLRQNAFKRLFFHPARRPLPVALESAPPLAAWPE